MARELKNFQCIITGGTGFLGREIVSEFIKNGAMVFTNYRTEEKFSDLKNYIGETEKLAGIKADLTSEAQVKEFFQEFMERYKRLDEFLHITGGFWMGKDIVDTSLKEWENMMKTNLMSAFLCTREAFRIMKAQCSGKIFTVSAKTAESLPANMGAYSVSKAGVWALTNVLAKEGKPYDILVNAILPSIIDTPANRQAMPDADYSDWVTPKDIAKMLVNLSKPEVKIMSETPIKIYGKL